MTLDIRTIFFQYKLLNRIVYTNKLLYKIKLSDTSLRTFCGEYEESLEHLNSYTVDSVKSFCPHWSFLNHILIIGKQVLYSRRLTKSQPLLSQFIVKLKHIERIEHYVAKNGDRFSFHEKKWKIIRK